MGPRKEACDSVHAPGGKSRVIKMVVADFLPLSLFYTSGVILLITKCIRGFWFHILERVSLNYPLPFQGYRPAGCSLIPPRLIAGLWQELRENGGCCMLGDHGGQWDSAAGLQAAPAVLWYSSHTKRRKNAKGEKRSSTSAETANQAKRREGGEERGRGWGMEARSRNQKQTLCCTVWFVMGPWLHQIPLLPFCVIFLPSLSCSSQMHAFVLPSAQSRGRQWDSSTVGSL